MFNILFLNILFILIGTIGDLLDLVIFYIHISSFVNVYKISIQVVLKSKKT